MLRNAAMASNALRRLVASPPCHMLMSPAMSTAIASVPRRHEFSASLGSAHQLFFPALLGQARGFARDGRPPAPSEDDDADLSEEELEVSDTDFDNKYFSEGEEVLDYEDEDEDEEQLE